MSGFGVCVNCIKLAHVKKRITTMLSEQMPMNCSICGCKQGIDISKNKEILQEIVDELRLNYPYSRYGKYAFDYGDCCGAGFFAPMIFSEDNLFFADKLAYSQANEFMNILAKETDLGSCDMFYCGENEEGQCIYKILSESHANASLKDAESVLINVLKKDLLLKNRYEIQEKYVEQFREVLMFLPKRRIYGRRFYRARNGYNREAIVWNDDKRMIQFPYIGEEMLAPPPYMASAGRFNTEGCAYLYVANKLATAVAEIKSYVGQKCTIAEILCNDKAQYLDFRKKSIDMMRFKCDIVKLNIIYSFKNLFSLPMHEKREYYVTQFIADIFRILGVGGIIYDSVQTDGYNVMSFNSAHFNCVQGSEKIVLLKKVIYEVEEVQDERKNYSDSEFVERRLNEKYKLKTSAEQNYDVDCATMSMDELLFFTFD